MHAGRSSHHRDRDEERRRRQRDDEPTRTHTWDRHHTRPTKQVLGSEAYLTPGLEETSYDFNAYSPFGTPPAAPPAYDERRPKHALEKDDYFGELQSHTGVNDDVELARQLEHHPTTYLITDAAEEKRDQKNVAKLERWGGPFIYILPIMTAIGLLFAATCSADGWRVKVNVVSVDLPNDIFARLLATGKNMGKSEPGDAASKQSEVKGNGSVESRAPGVVVAGYLSVGFWGWCISRPDQSE